MTSDPRAFVLLALIAGLVSGWHLRFDAAPFVREVSREVRIRVWERRQRIRTRVPR